MSTALDRSMDDFVLSFNDPSIIPDPYPVYHELRERSSAWYFPFFDGTWVFLRYRDVQSLLLDQRLSSDRADLPARAIPPEQRHQFSEMTAVVREWIGIQNQPVHRSMRRHLNRVAEDMLDPKPLRNRIQPFAERLVGAIQYGDTTDVIESLCYPLPSMVICDFIGVPIEDYRQVVAWAGDLAYAFGSSTLAVSDVERAQQSTLDLYSYIRDLATNHRLPHRSLLSRMLSMSTDGYRLSPDQAYAQCVQLLFAGLETTRYGIGNAIYALALNPGEANILRRHPDLLNGAVNELLRYMSPAQWIGRVARESFEYDGFTIRKGQVVLPYVGAANRDPEIFDSPDVLDVQRPKVHPMTFGHGPHHCIGAALVREQMRITLQLLLRRFDDFRQDDAESIVWNSNLGFHGHRFLPIRFATG